jgi:membrane-associated protease RseP (regulator of RpoE activity)
MNRDFLRCIVIAGLLSPFMNVPVGAQELPEPTLDERFREPDANAPKFIKPQLNPPQTKATDQPRSADAPPRAYLGVTFDTKKSQAIVLRVQPGSPAELAGLQPNDLIESLQGKPIRRYQDVLNIVARMRPGDTLDVGYSRRMNVRTQAALAQAPGPTQRSVGYPPDLPLSGAKAPEDPDYDALPMPETGGSENDRDQTRASNQRRNYNQDGGQPEQNQRFRFRGLRRR